MAASFSTCATNRRISYLQLAPAGLNIARIGDLDETPRSGRSFGIVDFDAALSVSSQLGAPGTPKDAFRNVQPKRSVSPKRRK